MHEYDDEDIQTKPWWESRRMVGLLVTTICMVAGVFGYSLDASALTEIALVAAQLVGLVIAFIGSIQAKKPIDPGAVAPGIRIPGVKPKPKLRVDEMPSATSRTADDQDTPGPFGF